MKRYVFNILIALSQLLSTLVGGWPDETASSYAYRMWMEGKRAGFLKTWIDWIFFTFFRDRDHCHKAYVSEQERKQWPPSLREAA